MTPSPAPDPQRVVIQTDALTEAQRQHLFSFEPDVFGLRHLNLEWEPKTRFFPVQVAGQVVANAGLVARTVYVGGEPIPVAGVGSVVTRPESRGRGHATAAIEAALTYARREGSADFAMLFCRAPLMPFYARMGFLPLPPPVLIEQQGTRLPSPLEVMVRPLTDRQWSPGPVDVNGRPW